MGKEDVYSPEEKVYKVGKRVLGKKIKVNGEEVFCPLMKDSEIFNLIEGMSVPEKLNVERNCREFFRKIGVDVQNAISDYELLIYVADGGYESLEELEKSEPGVGKLVKSRGLEKRLFSSDASLEEDSSEGDSRAQGWDVERLLEEIGEGGLNPGFY